MQYCNIACIILSGNPSFVLNFTKVKKTTLPYSFNYRVKLVPLHPE